MMFIMTIAIAIDSSIDLFNVQEVYYSLNEQNLFDSPSRVQEIIVGELFLISVLMYRSYQSHSPSHPNPRLQHCVE